METTLGPTPLSALPRGHHACLLYTHVQEAIAAVAPFIRAGLEANERCVYVLGEHPRDQVNAQLQAAGVDVAAWVGRGALAFVDKWEVSFPNGEFDPEAMIAYVRENIAAATRDGFAALRVVAEMTWALQLGVGHNKLIHYEAIGNHLYPDEPLVAVCMYDRARFPAEVCQDALRVHPVVGTGASLQSNVFYELPDTVLSGSGGADRLDWMLEQLERLRVASEEHAELVRARAVSIAKDELLSTVAHELKNPLAAASTVAQLTLRKVKNGRLVEPAEVQRTLELVVRHARRQTRIIDDVMAAAKLASGPLHVKLEQHDLATLVRQEVAMRQLLTPEADLRVDAPETAPVMADADRIEQLVGNLLDNAIKFSPPHPKVQVRLLARAGGYELTVSDQGDGIPEADRERVFDRYERGTQSDKRGLGLGLHICRNIVQRHGGEIHAEGNEGGGTRMVVTLPAA